jgi:hypothetical protein
MVEKENTRPNRPSVRAILLRTATGSAIGKTRAYPLVTETGAHVFPQTVPGTIRPSLRGVNHAPGRFFRAPMHNRESPPSPDFDALALVKRILREKTHRRKTLPAATRSLHPGALYEIRQIQWPIGAGKPRGFRIITWHAAVRAAFPAGAPLLSARRHGTAYGDFFAADITLTAPEDGILIRRDDLASGPMEGALGAFIPLTQWRAFLALLERQQAAIAQSRDAARRVRHRRRRLRTEKRDISRQEVSLRQEEMTLERERRDLNQRINRLATETAAFATREQALSGLSLAELARLLACKLPSSLSSLPEDGLTSLLVAIRDILERGGAFSLAEQLRLKDDLDVLSRVEHGFLAIDRRSLEIYRNSDLVPEERQRLIDETMEKRMEVLTKAFEDGSDA